MKIENISDHLFLDICKFLDLADIGNLAVTSKNIRNIIKNNIYNIFINAHYSSVIIDSLTSEGIIPKDIISEYNLLPIKSKNITLVLIDVIALLISSIINMLRHKK